MTKPLTVRDIAEKAGVSLGTVSRVMNNAANIDPALKEHTLTVIRENNYIPLRRPRRNTRRSAAEGGRIAVLFCDMPHQWNESYFSRSYAAGIEAVAMCSDYCMNAGPFLSPELFAEFVTPFLKLQVAELRKLGFYTIKHTDGNIMPIIDQLAECAPDALHSLDPQGGVDIAEVKKRYGDRLCLIGNVNCGLMDTGTDAEVAASAEYALRHGMPGGGYVFSTSNCIYTGMPLEHYELILKIRHEKGVYPLPPADSSDEKEDA